ncbi:hypothetical protein P613_01215 [Borreliella valaisiana Tom4006]|nr:hypothetical protein P613_01215 [Borreliella valaisiana Tom4006]
MNLDILNFFIKFYSVFLIQLGFLYYSLLLSKKINIFNYKFINFVFNILFLIKINVNNLKILSFKLLISFLKIYLRFFYFILKFLHWIFLLVKFYVLAILF